MHSGCGFQSNVPKDGRVACYGQRMSSLSKCALDPYSRRHSEVLPICGHPLLSLYMQSRRTWAVSCYLGKGLLVDAKRMVAHCYGCTENIAACGMANQFSDSEWSSSQLNGTVYTTGP